MKTKTRFARASFTDFSIYKTKHALRRSKLTMSNKHNIGVGSGAAGAALAAPIFCLVAVLGPRCLFRYASCFVL